jgi:alpha-L-rhamnosidase
MATPPVVTDLRFEHHPTGLGLQESSPRISWRYGPGANQVPKNWLQTSYEVQVQRQGGEEPKTFTFPTGKSVLVPWPDAPLVSRERANVRVRASGVSSSVPGTTDGTKLDTEWSAWTPVEAALLGRQDWTASFITSSRRTSFPETVEEGKRVEYFRPIRLRKTFTLGPKPARARLHITALGIYVAYLNGKRIGEEQLAPGWTSYRHRIQYQTLDVGNLLNADGANTLAIEVGEGWYAGRIVWGEGFTCFYGDEIGALAQLEVFPDGASQPQLVANTDDSWEWRESPILSAGLYDGEVCDLRQEEGDWHSVGNQNTKYAAWQSAKKLPFPESNLLASPCPPVTITEHVKPVKIFKSPSGKVLVDFGQNLVGKVVIHSLQRPSGHELVIRHAEVLENGELGIRPLRCAKATDIIIFSDSTLSEYSPQFTFHGFRYIELTGWSPEDESQPLTLGSLSAAVMHNAMVRTGHLTTSNDLLNKLISNITWSLRSNFVSIPSDCPQRDERLGWTGDIQVFGPTASFLYDSSGFLSNWLRDLVYDQKQAGGIVPFVIPDVMPNGPWPHMSQAVWDDVVVLLPWTLYQWSGDTKPLAECYDGMLDFLRTVPRDTDALWEPLMWKLGDWLDPSAPPEDPSLACTDATLVADAYLVHSTRTVARVAAVLGQTDDAARFRHEADTLAAAFRHKYVASSGLVVGDTQTALALALVFGLHEDADDDDAGRALATRRLAKWVQAARCKVSTGFAGTNAILPALSVDVLGAPSNLQLAYQMLQSTECPSWLYPVRMGATTIWERWDSILPSGEINPGEMTSFNHYALGSVAAWMHETIGGLSFLEDENGQFAWKKFRVRPRPGGDVTSAKAEFLSGYGLVKCAWEISESEGQGKRFKMQVTVPPSTTAVVELPDPEHGSFLVGSGEYSFECAFKDPEWPPKTILPF